MHVRVIVLRLIISMHPLNFLIGVSQSGLPVCGKKRSRFFEGRNMNTASLISKIGIVFSLQ